MSDPQPTPGGVTPDWVGEVDPSRLTFANRPPEPGISLIGSMARTVGHRALPAAGGFAGAGAGAELFGGLGTAVAPGIGTTIGAIGGGLIGGFGGDSAVSYLQDKIVPDRVKQILGWDPKQVAADEAAHPIGTFVASALPQVGMVGRSKNVLQAAIGGVIGGGSEAISEATGDQPFSAWRIAGATGIGAGFGGDPYRYTGRIAFGAGQRAARAIIDIPYASGATTAVQGARDVLANVQEAGLAKLYGTMPPEALRRLASNGSIDDHAAIAGQTIAWGDESADSRWTPEERAAVTVADHNIFVRDNNPFQPGPAGDAEHGARLGATMAAIIAGQPLPDFGPPAATRGTLAAATTLTPSGDVIARGKAAIGQNESHGRYDMPNQGGSSAYGKYQFMPDTWIKFAGQATGLDPIGDRARLLAMRSDPGMQERVMDRALESYRSTLQRAGAPVTPGNLYLLHFLGEAGGLKVLRAAADTPVEALLSRAAIDSNPRWLKGKTAGDLVADMAARTGGAKPEDVPLRTAPEEVAEAETPAALPELADEPVAPSAVPPDRVQAGDIADRGSAGSRGPQDMLAFLARNGGISDAENHALAGDRNLQTRIPGTGMLVRPNGMSVDQAGELLWERGWLPDADPSNPDHRPTTDQVLDMIERAKAEPVYHPAEQGIREEAAVRASNREAMMRASHALDDAIAHAQEHGISYDIGPKEHEWASQEVARGRDPGEALQALFDHDRNDLADTLGTTPEKLRLDRTFPDIESDADFFDRMGRETPQPSPSFDPAIYRNDLARFDDPFGEAAKAMTNSIEHDLQMMVAAGGDGVFELADGSSASVGDMLSALAEERREIEETRGCMAPVTRATE